MDRSAPTLNWDIFCKVIDNFGDVGVCWRLARDLAARGHFVRLWIDDASALSWMAPGGCEGVQVLGWADPLDIGAAALQAKPTDALVEAFGCDVPAEFLAACAQVALKTARPPVWINLEYLSAEPYVERSHALPSPVFSGPAAGWTKWFFYPGFTGKTGGLLREPGLATRQSAFDAEGWLRSHGLQPVTDAPEKRIVLFCYEPPALAGLMRQLAANGLAGQAVRLLVTAGRPARAVRDVLETWASAAGSANATDSSGRVADKLAISFVPLLSQDDFDHLLWSSDLNFVRGEDSVVRAIWAGKPFVWQIYPQDDGVHAVKLDAFLDALGAPPSLRLFHHLWNDSPGATADLPHLASVLPDWTTVAIAARARLAAEDDLTSRLVSFVRKNR